MSPESKDRPFVFPKWVNRLKLFIPAALGAGGGYAALLFALAASPSTHAVGYQPRQPVPYKHSLHAGEMGIDCRYCHTTVEDAAHAAIPPTQVCMNCHGIIHATNPKHLPVRESNATGMPIPWVRVHDLPDYVYFDHSAHVRRGVGCVSCHGRIDRMDEVYQFAPLSMGWCLDCHRNPEQHLRPPELVTRMDWVPEDDPLALGRRLRELLDLNPSTDCSTCHR